ncbi:MAG: DNA primase, partial [Propionibacteriaceae bacterium]
AYVALRNAGGGSLKGLCPFHDEKTPSFQVTPARGFFYCFGCGEGGDVITFQQKIDSLSFAEAVERLADRVGIVLRYTEQSGPRQEPGLRLRLMEANQAAEEFYTEQLSTPDALIGRQFLGGRGFDRAAAERFGVGFAPTDGKALLKHLRGRGFSDTELVKAGLTRESGWDFFQGRLLWPIRDSGKQVLGFGARRLRDDDRMPAKYLNTPETPLYKKSHVLYGLDLARKQISAKSQAVVVEGYTDVMAAHLSGVDTAVAVCGTAFGDDHARLLRRLMGDHDAFHGEVIFTFDGDRAGQNAALKVFAGDQNFITQTYVAVEPTGLDPCDLRLQHGDAAVRELVARRMPLYRFVMSNMLGSHDLDRADGRLEALRATAPLVGSIRDSSLVNGYARELAGLLGMDPDEVRAEVSRAASRSSRRTPAPEPVAAPPEPKPTGIPIPDPRDRHLALERETAQLLVQAPEQFPEHWDGLSP